MVMGRVLRCESKEKNHVFLKAKKKLVKSALKQDLIIGHIIFVYVQKNLLKCVNKSQ